MPAPRPDPIAQTIRERRTARGMSLQALAAAATSRLPRRSRGRRPPTVSAGYLSLIENGFKVPDVAVALAIAAALGADEAVFRAWVTARKHAGLDAALEAAEVLRGFRSGNRPTADGPLEMVPAPLESTATGSAGAVGSAHARLRVPVIREGDDPGSGVRPSCAILEWRALDIESLSAETLMRVDRPVAIRLAAAAAGLGLSPGDHVLVLRNLSPPLTECVCAVRESGRVALRRLWWDGRQALVLPPQGEHGFVVFDAADTDTLAERVLGIARHVEFGS